MKNLCHSIYYKFSKWLLYTTVLYFSLINFTGYARTTDSLAVSVSTELVISEIVNSASETASYGYFFLHSPAHQNFQSISANFVVLAEIYSKYVSTKFRQQKLNQYYFNHNIYCYLKIISSEVSAENPPHSRS
jgi:hypothetical protein